MTKSERITEVLNSSMSECGMKPAVFECLSHDKRYRIIDYAEKVINAQDKLQYWINYYKRESNG